MGERYDMDHIYYVDGKDWHGASHYYEYPCVFIWVLVQEYLGIRSSLKVDLLISPRLDRFGKVTLDNEAHALANCYQEDHFILENRSSRERVFEVGLSALFQGNALHTINPEPRLFKNGQSVRLSSGAFVQWNVTEG